MVKLIRPTVIIFALFCVSSASKAFMDTINFVKGGFSHFPEWFQVWAYSKGTFPILKIDDGWHSFQALMFLSFGMALYYAGWTANKSVWQYGLPVVRPWRYLVIGFIIVWALRLACQFVIFEQMYPVL